MRLDFSNIFATVISAGIISITAIAWRSYNELTSIGYSIAEISKEMEASNKRIDSNNLRISDNERRIIKLETKAYIEKELSKEN